MKKIYPLDRLKAIIEKRKQEGDRIVLANGCFDLIHVGHIRYLKESKKKGDVLVVALNSDASVRRLKGRGRPILLEKDRGDIIASFYFVDYVTFFDEDRVEKVLRVLKPHVHAKGSDYTVNTVPERATVKKMGGEIAITGGPKVKSTSEIIQEIAAKCVNENEP